MFLSHFLSYCFLKLRGYPSLHLFQVCLYSIEGTCTHSESTGSPVVNRKVKGPKGQWAGSPFLVVCNDKSWSWAVTRSSWVQGVNLNLMRFHPHLEKGTITALYNHYDKFMSTLFWLFSKLHTRAPFFFKLITKICDMWVDYNYSSHTWIILVQIL